MFAKRVSVKERERKRRRRLRECNYLSQLRSPFNVISLHGDIVRSIDNVLHIGTDGGRNNREFFERIISPFSQDNIYVYERMYLETL